MEISTVDRVWPVKSWVQIHEKLGRQQFVNALRERGVLKLVSTFQHKETRFYSLIYPSFLFNFNLGLCMLSNFQFAFTTFLSFSPFMISRDFCKKWTSITFLMISNLSCMSHAWICYLQATIKLRLESNRGYWQANLISRGRLRACNQDHIWQSNNYNNVSYVIIMNISENSFSINGTGYLNCPKV
jgi:hypothetical protein